MSSRGVQAGLVWLLYLVGIGVLDLPLMVRFVVFTSIGILWLVLFVYLLHIKMKAIFYSSTQFSPIHIQYVL